MDSRQLSSRLNSLFLTWGCSWPPSRGAGCTADPRQAAPWTARASRLGFAWCAARQSTAKKRTCAATQCTVGGSVGVELLQQQAGMNCKAIKPATNKIPNTGMVKNPKTPHKATDSLQVGIGVALKWVLAWHATYAMKQRVPAAVATGMTFGQ